MTSTDNQSYIDTRSKEEEDQRMSTNYQQQLETDMQYTIMVYC